MKKKTLIARLQFDVTPMPDKALEAFKAYLAAIFESNDVSFEVNETDEETSLERLLKSVQQEFSLQDQATPAPDQDQDTETTPASENVTSIAEYLFGQTDNGSTPPLD